MDQRGFFDPPPRRPLARTRSEDLDHYGRAWDYSKAAREDFESLARQAEIYQPPESQRAVLDAINESLEKWGESYSQRRRIEKKTARYIRTRVVPTGLMGGAAAIADRLDACRNSGVLGVDINSGRKQVRWHDKCGLVKLCPDEARQEQKRLAKRYAPAAEEWLKQNRRRQFQYAVFEPVNVPLGGLKDGIRAAYHELRCLLRHKSMKAVKGCFAAIECPMGRDGNSWNVHINCLFLVDGNFPWDQVRAEYGQRIHFESSLSMARKTAEYLARRGQLDARVSRAEVLACAFREIIKYSAKHVSSKGESGKTDAPGITEWPPAAFVEWYGAHKGLRRCRSYGVLYNVSEPESEPLVIEWIGLMSFDRTTKRYNFAMAGTRRPIISLQGDNSTIHSRRKRRQATSQGPP